MSIYRIRRLILFIVVGCAVVVSAGVPPVSHLGRVLDSETREPVIGVEVLGYPDEWPIDVPRKATSRCFSDSMGIYSVGLNCPGNVHFFKAGYDSLVLHWPEEFEGSDQGGCGITLGPVYLSPTSSD